MALKCLAAAAGARAGGIAGPRRVLAAVARTRRRPVLAALQAPEAATGEEGAASTSGRLEEARRPARAGRRQPARAVAWHRSTAGNLVSFRHDGSNVQVDERQQQDEEQRRRDFYANVGDAIRTLREDIPLLFHKDLNCELPKPRLLVLLCNIYWGGPLWAALEYCCRHPPADQPDSLPPPPWLGRDPTRADQLSYPLPCHHLFFPPPAPTGGFPSAHAPPFPDGSPPCAAHPQTPSTARTLCSGTPASPSTA